jgi:hypothetical protein
LKTGWENNNTRPWFCRVLHKIINIWKQNITDFLWIRSLFLTIYHHNLAPKLLSYYVSSLRLSQWLIWMKFDRVYVTFEMFIIYETYLITLQYFGTLWVKLVEDLFEIFIIFNLLWLPYNIRNLVGLIKTMKDNDLIPKPSLLRFR